MKRERSLLAHALMGVVAGVAATWAMDRATGLMYQREGDEAREQEDEAREGKTAYGVAAEKAAAVVDKELSSEQRQRYGSGVHWALGAGAGALYGVLRQRVPQASLGFGTLYGALFWLVVDEAANSSLGLTPMPQAFPWETHARGLAGHLLYGASAEVALTTADALL